MRTKTNALDLGVAGVTVTSFPKADWFLEHQRSGIHTFQVDTQAADSTVAVNVKPNVLAFRIATSIVLELWACMAPRLIRVTIFFLIHAIAVE